ncbi:hypothetical protein ACLKA6_008856 [Drosophila palustris]
MPLGRKSPEVLAGKEAIPAQSPKLHAAAVPYYPGQRQLAVAMANSSACHVLIPSFGLLRCPMCRGQAQDSGSPVFCQQLQNENGVDGCRRYICHRCSSSSSSFSFYSSSC